MILYGILVLGLFTAAFGPIGFIVGLGAWWVAEHTGLY